MAVQQKGNHTTGNDGECCTKWQATGNDKLAQDTVRGYVKHIREQSHTLTCKVENHKEKCRALSAEVQDLGKGSTEHSKD